MFKVLAFQIADSIDIKSFKSAFTAEIYYSDNDELFYQVGTHKFIYVFKYGVVCFLDHSEVEMSGFLQLISPFCRNTLKERLSDEFEIETDASKFQLGFNKVSITEPDTEMLRLIMMHVSQSVALDHFEILTNQLLEEANSHTQVLEIKGKLDLSGTSLKRYIGKTLNLKNRIAENLYIFDSPEETWEDERLSKLDLGLKKTFDLQSRFRTIEEGLAIVKENLELFKDLLQYRKSMALEWIVIILIAVEVLNLVVEKFFGK
ncbi:RMD1 family protein [Flavihumibacter profundi]|jgi:required for meiotic nuclear division protein 1|uniref:RMD1 family protein n=1 Tax=Flavihumibacter profundi TaxID=2716883 RepID=UPI001CC65296|nr:RMD1 family protein [Flavihumibacter profundi]MBZ5857216.1 RMD1 family protein [Flavihumibacter profundi]